MRRMFIAAALALGVLWINVASAEQLVSKVWNTSEAAYAHVYDFNDVWSPVESQLTATTVFDESNRFQYTDVAITRQGWGIGNYSGAGYIYFYRSMSCRIYGSGVLKVTENQADLVATTLDPTSPDCSNYGYRMDCDESWNCTYNQNYGYSGARVVNGHWERPQLTRSATSNVQEVNFFPLRRSNTNCKTSKGRMLSGSFSIGTLFWGEVGDGIISRTHCQATQQQIP